MILPEGPSVFRENLEGRQYGNESGKEPPMVGRLKRSVCWWQVG